VPKWLKDKNSIASKKNLNRKGLNKNRTKARKINASTAYETCSEQLSPFGGLLALIKFLDLVNFHKIFNLRLWQMENLCLKKY
jgi:hypothetical protein